MGISDMFKTSPEAQAEREQRRAQRDAEKLRRYQERQAARAEREAFTQELKDHVREHKHEQLVSYEGIHVFPDVIIRLPSMMSWDGVTAAPERHPTAGVRATVETAGEIYARTTLTRSMVPGMHGWQKKVDEREAFMVIEGQGFTWQLKLQHQKFVLPVARSAARQITNAGNAAAHRAAPAQQLATTPSVADELRKLAELRDAGVLTPEEFEFAKARLLG